VLTLHADASTAPKDAVIPVFISLLLFADLRQPSARKSLMAEVFGKLLNVNSASVPLFERERFLFMFDGLDELGFHFNLFDDCRLQDWASHTVFVITSRLRGKWLQYLDFCRRLAFAMFKRGVTSWTVQHEQVPQAAAAQVKVNLRQQFKQASISEAADIHDFVAAGCGCD
jgi:hypothetical protein